MMVGLRNISAFHESARNLEGWHFLRKAVSEAARKVSKNTKTAELK